MQTDDPPKLGACERCHRRKAKCDKAQPACSSCIKADTACVYASKDPGVRRLEVEKLERRVRQLEAKNEALSSELRDARRRADSVSQSSTVHGHLSVSESRPNGVNGSNEGQNNEVASQVSYLSLSAGGERQFLGSASGLLLANLLQANLKPDSRTRTEDVNLNNPGGHRFGKSSYSRSGVSTPHEGALPPEKLARSLLSAYLGHDHLCYPFLSPRLLFQAVDAIYVDPNFYADHPVDAFFIDMILAIGTTQVYKFEWQVLPDAETHHDRAMDKFSFVLGKGGIIALQAVLLVCQYRMGSSMYDTSASLWHLIGMAARMCFELGMHREAFYEPVNRNGNEPTEEELDESAVKRRCFWCVIAMDRIASITLGRPLAIRLDDVDTELPMTETNLAMSPDVPLSPDRPLDSPQWHFRTAIFVHIVRYRIICGKILTSLHNTTKSKEQAADYRIIRDELSKELERWHADTVLLPLPREDVGSTMPQDRSSFRAREWYDLLYHNGVLMLFRPSPSLSDLTQNSTILQRIYEAAQNSVLIYGYLHRSRKINYSWITLHAVFIAGLSYIYAIRSHFQSRRKSQIRNGEASGGGGGGACLQSDPTISQVVNDTRTCSNVLVAVSERWSTARNCYQVYGRLSDAVLKDVIDFQSEIVSGVHVGPSYPAMQFDHADAATPMGDQHHASVMRQPPAFPMAVDSTLQDCFDDLQQFYIDPFGNDPIMRLSQDWLFDIQGLEGSF